MMALGRSLVGTRDGGAHGASGTAFSAAFGATVTGGDDGSAAFGLERQEESPPRRAARTGKDNERLGGIGGLPSREYRSNAPQGERSPRFRRSAAVRFAGGYPVGTMRRSLRALIFFLAVLPAVWGTCPGWLMGACCCAPAAASSTKAACCPLCRERDEKSRRAPCSHCPCTMARNGSAPAPAAVEAPAIDLAVGSSVVPSDAGPVARPIRREVRVDIRPPGGPPDLVGIVVLLV